VEKLEADKANYKSRVKELTDENSMWQKKVQDSASHFGASDREDSPDVLSEIDRQEELYQKINMKNKHIKRLLRDIEALEKQNIGQISIINELKANLSDATLNLTTLTLQFSESQAMITEQKESLAEQYSKQYDLQGQIKSLQNEENAREQEIQSFGQKLEERAELWRKVLDEKENEIEELKQKYQRVAEQNPGYEIDAERFELTRLTKSLEERDEIIKELECKIDQLTEEMIGTTNIFNKISANKEENRQKGLIAAATGKCCEENRILLEKSNGRCKDLQEFLAQTEQDGSLKAKQAMEAMEALRAYENGEDGLTHALQKNQRLQGKIKSRDKQIHALIMEMNSLNEVATENCVLR
jgi:centrosomal protein CEP290